MTSSRPTMKAVVLGDISSQEHPKWDPIEVRDLPKPASAADNESIVQMKAAALNHRDLFIRQGLYPGIKSGAVMCADGVGTVVQGVNKGQRVVFHPAQGWKDDPRGPELTNGRAQFVIRGGTTFANGTLQEFMHTTNELIHRAPEFLSDAEAAALPLAGLTAYRALVTKCQAQKGENFLVTGIGGGVAIFALQFAIALGCNVWVSSSKEEKIERAIKLGAKGGVNYKDDGWSKKLASQLPKDRPFLDAIIDSGGGDIVDKAARLLRTGGIVTQFGQTSGKPSKFTMVPILMNVELRGSTMGNAKEFNDMVEFVIQHKIKPVVSDTFQGFQEVEKAFELMKNGEQFGKIVVVMSTESKL